ncbi:replication protein O [Caballeronia humi]|uniref:Replication protein O n=1 Tax=Caballeronia humi TaxID=326474 RepID=A0A158IH19_9BURK|nr:replication protein O [Caballeronia humi]SAL55855.1 hypothetical protein AWB65_04810 [Caballeronia humi]
MLIAQLPVAGEENCRLLASTSVGSNEDRAAIEEYACDRSNLPWIIFRAAHRANHVEALPSRSRALLAALARTVDANRPYAAIFARRELLTGRALQSMRTFYRSLDDLEAEGFIVRPPQKRYGNAGLFGRAYLHLTDKAAALLGLVDDHGAESPPQDTQAFRNVAETETSFSPATPCVTVADGPIYKDLYPKTQKRQSARLPEDLQRLLSLGFHEFLIFKLMREAKQSLKRLSEVVEATWEHLKHAKCPINYLRALLRSPVDFAHQLRAKHAARVEAETIRRRAHEIDAILKQHAGETFFDLSTDRRFDLSADVSEIIVRHHAEPSPRVRVANWAEDFVVAIEEGRIVRATPERTFAFAAKLGQSISSANLDHASMSARQKPVRTSVIDQRLNEMKRLLRKSCAGVVATGSAIG